jgi:hypothetical protein
LLLAMASPIPMLMTIFSSFGTPIGLVMPNSLQSAAPRLFDIALLTLQPSYFSNE